MRLHLGKEALSKYDLHLFGTKGIQFIGYGGSTESVYSYNYVDSSYIQMLFTYGIFPLIILIILYVLQSWKSYKQGKHAEDVSFLEQCYFSVCHEIFHCAWWYSF